MLRVKVGTLGVMVMLGVMWSGSVYAEERTDCVSESLPVLEQLEEHLEGGRQDFASGSMKEAVSAFKCVLSGKELLTSQELKGREARAVLAEATFMLAEVKFQEMAAIKLDSVDEKKVQAQLKAKKAKGVATIKLLNGVFGYKSDVWSVASYSQIGHMYEIFAQELRQVGCPERLNVNQCEIFLGLTEEAAGDIDVKAGELYVKAVKLSKRRKVTTVYARRASEYLVSFQPERARELGIVVKD